MITDEQFKGALSGIATGLTVADACALQGFTDRTFYNHVNNDVQKFQQYKKAVIQNKLSHIDNIKKAGEKQWQASAWYLERMYPEEYGRREHINLRGTIENKLTLEISFDETLKRLEELKKLQSAEDINYLETNVEDTDEQNN